MKEEWEVLEEFPRYAVSNLGNVANIKLGVEIHPSINQQGVAKVSFSHNGVVYTRGLALLVAQLFVPYISGYRADLFNTPINLDGNRLNCRADNLTWRPRWFAIRYHQQFEHEKFFEPFPRPIEELNTGGIFKSFAEVCVPFGLYHMDVIKSWMENRPTFPTGHVFRLIEDD